MRKKWLTGIVLVIGLVCVGLAIQYYLNPLNDPDIAFDLNQGDVFELKQDVFLYYYLNEKSAIVPGNRYPFSFTVDQLRNDPNLGVRDRDRGCYIGAIITKGAMIQFTGIDRKHNWNSGAYFIYYGKIISGEQSSGTELSIRHLLFDTENKRTDMYLNKK